MTSALTKLELAVIAEVAKQLTPIDRAALQAQTTCLTVRDREHTGGGFFTYFDLKAEAAAPINTDTKECYVKAKIQGLKFGLGFILWLKEGRLDCLEGYSIACEDTLPLDLTSLTFEVVPGAKLMRLPE